MNILKKIRSMLVLAAVMTVLEATAVWAGTTVDFAGGENAQVGGTVDITVTMQNDDRIAESDMFINFDSAKLQFVSGDDMELLEDGRVRIRGDYADEPSQKSWTLHFTALAEGDVTLRAENVWVKDGLGETGTGITANSKTLSISGQAAAPAATTAAEGAAGEVPAVETSGDALSALEQEIANDGTMSCLVNGEKWFVKEEFGVDILMPNFVLASAFYKGVEVTAAKLNNAEYYLLLVQSEDGSQEKFAVYDQEQKTFADIRRLDNDSNSVLYLTDAPADEIPSYFEETTYKDNRAWQITGNTAHVPYAADPSEYYILYGYDQQGNLGWHIVDSVTGMFERYVELAPVVTEQAEEVTVEDPALSAKYDELMSKFEFLVTCIKYAAVALIALLLLLLVVNLADKGDDGDKPSDKKTKKEAKKEEKKKLKEEKKNAKKKQPETEQSKEDEAGQPEAKPDKPVNKKTAEAASQKKAEQPAPQKQPEQETPKKNAAAVKANPDEFVDDYIEVNTAAPQNAQEEKAIGVLKPVLPEASQKEAEKSIQDSIAELSRQIQKTMREEKPSVNVAELEELTFIDVDDK